MVSLVLWWIRTFNISEFTNLPGMWEEFWHRTWCRHAILPFCCNSSIFTLFFSSCLDIGSLPSLLIASIFSSTFRRAADKRISPRFVHKYTRSSESRLDARVEERRNGSLPTSVTVQSDVMSGTPMKSLKHSVRPQDTTWTQKKTFEETTASSEQSCLRGNKRCATADLQQPIVKCLKLDFPVEPVPSTSTIGTQLHVPTNCYPL